MVARLSKPLVKLLQSTCKYQADLVFWRREKRLGGRILYRSDVVVVAAPFSLFGCLVSRFGHVRPASVKPKHGLVVLEDG